MDEVVIRRARFEDLRSVSEIVVASWKDAYRGIVDDEYLDGLTVEENYRRRAGNFTDDGFVVAEVNGEVVAFCRYVFENAYADRFPDVDCELCALYVKPDCKDNGVGKKLIRLVMQDFKDRGYRRMLLWCFKDNFPARVFYEKMGGVYGGTGMVSRGGKDYEEVCYVYDLERFPKEELVLVFPTYEYKEQIEEYAKEFYDYGSKFKLSMMYNEKNESIEWYFDVARNNGFAFEDDLYLDVLVTSDGEVKLLDRDEFDEAHDRFEVSDEDYEIGLREANELIERLEGCREGLRDFTDKYLHKFMRDFDN